MNNSSEQVNPSAPIEATILALEAPAHIQQFKSTVDAYDKACFAAHPGSTQYVRYQIHGEWWPYVTAYSRHTLVTLLPGGHIGKVALPDEAGKRTRLPGSTRLAERIARDIGYPGEPGGHIVSLDDAYEPREWWDKYHASADDEEALTILVAQRQWRAAKAAQTAEDWDALCSIPIRITAREVL